MQLHQKSRKLTMGYLSIPLLYISATLANRCSWVAFLWKCMITMSRLFSWWFSIFLSCLNYSSTIFILPQLAKRLHPDTNKDDPEAEKKFQEVQKAYEVLDFLNNFPVYQNFQILSSLEILWYLFAVFIIGLERWRKAPTVRSGFKYFQIYYMRIADLMVLIIAY